MKAEISMPQVMRQVTIEAKVTGMAVTKLRLWLGCRIMKLAALVMGCTVEVEIER